MTNQDARTAQCASFLMQGNGLIEVLIALFIISTISIEFLNAQRQIQRQIHQLEQGIDAWLIKSKEFETQYPNIRQAP